MWITADDSGEILASSSHEIIGGAYVGEFEFEHDMAAYRFVNGEVNYCEKRHLEFAKKLKEEELSNASDGFIRNGFEFEVDGEVLLIPNDTHDALNLQGAVNIINKNIGIDAVPWTSCRDTLGKARRFLLTRDMVTPLSLTALMHSNLAISHFRDVLMERVSAANTVEEVEAVEWGSPLRMRGYSAGIEKCLIEWSAQGLNVNELKG